MRRKIIIVAYILLVIPFLFYLLHSITSDNTFSPTFIILAFLSILGMMFTEKDNSMFRVTFTMFVASIVGLFSEIIQFFLS
ncbi:hypothetical protein [Marinilactibacillus kalidii]|uniref:hypothetical protein n=1 Tax=Marinilactibacillus kalidii TaxID=2820274 RepID=UPI001ABE8B04|nr:hypothetical protein [Marinilactibacillus kalidii]